MFRESGDYRQNTSSLGHTLKGRFDRNGLGSSKLFRLFLERASPSSQPRNNLVN